MKKIATIAAIMTLILAGCQEKKEMAPDEIQKEPTYALKADDGNGN